MTETTTKKSHYLRNRDKEPKNIFKIVRRKEHDTGTTVLDEFKNFTLKNIFTPEALNSGANKNKPADPLPKPKTLAQSAEISKDEAMAVEQDKTTEGSDKMNLAKNTQLRLQEQQSQRDEGALREPTKLDLPDLFVNIKVKDAEKFLKYPYVPHLPSARAVPEFYVHHKDKVNSTQQTTEEKFWTFEDKMYEITEEKVEQLKEHKINITPSDFEWVVDCFEKTAINDGTQYLPKLKEYFKQRMPEDI